jgi:hypothetical protein
VSKRKGVNCPGWRRITARSKGISKTPPQRGKNVAETNLRCSGFGCPVFLTSERRLDSGGTSGRGSNPFQREKDLTLDTAKRVRELLRRSGLRVVMMREGDYFIELDERVARANKEGLAGDTLDAAA